jgi:hypothetical protein
MNSRFLASANSELDLLVWRAEVHKFSIDEVEQALVALREKILGSYPDLDDAGTLLEDFFESNQHKLGELKKSAMHNPPAGLMWSI